MSSLFTFNFLTSFFNLFMVGAFQIIFFVKNITKYFYRLIRLIARLSHKNPSLISFSRNASRLFEVE